ncbi:MAG: DUF4160 domain-containing protein [Planctomycetota bacterium]
MPTVPPRIGPYRFYFFSVDGKERPHVHVTRDRKKAKFWLVPTVEIEWSKGFNAHEVGKVQRLVSEHRDQFLESWNAYFNR